MKIDAHVPGKVPTSTAVDARRRLSGEATFDRTLQQMESGMWRGADAGRQPTQVLPHGVMPSAAAAYVPLAARLGSMPMPTFVPVHSGNAQVVPGMATDFVSPSAIGTVLMSTALDPDVARPGSAVLEKASPGLAGVDEAPDDPTPTRQPVTARPRDAEPVVESSRVTWMEGAAGTTVVLRQLRRDQADLHFVRDALAQLRRHGLDPKRLIINGVTTPYSFRSGDFA